MVEKIGSAFVLPPSPSAPLLRCLHLDLGPVVLDFVGLLEWQPMMRMLMGKWWCGKKLMRGERGCVVLVKWSVREVCVWVVRRRVMSDEWWVRIERHIQSCVRVM
jgi:hypothetical protein